MICDDCIHGAICINCTEGTCEDYISEKVISNIRWTDKISITSNGDIIDFDGNVVGHINLSELKGAGE